MRAWLKLSADLLVLLAAAVPALGAERVLDVCAFGAASLLQE